MPENVNFVLELSAASNNANPTPPAYTLPVLDIVLRIDPVFEYENVVELTTVTDIFNELNVVEVHTIETKSPDVNPCAAVVTIVATLLPFLAIVLIIKVAPIIALTEVVALPEVV